MIVITAKPLKPVVKPSLTWPSAGRLAKHLQDKIKRKHKISYQNSKEKVYLNSLKKQYERKNQNWMCSGSFEKHDSFGDFRMSALL